MWTVPVIAMQPLRQIGTSFTRMSIGTPVGPFAQGSLDEALGFSVGARRVDMPQAPTSTHRIKWQRAKHLAVVGHDAAKPVRPGRGSSARHGRGTPLRWVCA